MQKHDFYMRTDFFKLEQIRELRIKEDSSGIIVAYLFLNYYTDEDGYIHDDDIREIAADMGIAEDVLRNRIEQLLENELAELGGSGFWIVDMADLH